jgi:hypothetical protein
MNIEQKSSPLYKFISKQFKDMKKFNLNLKSLFIKNFEHSIESKKKAFF